MRMPCPTGPRLECISGLTLVTLVLDWFFWFSWNVVWGLDYREFLRFAPSILLLDDWGFYQARSGSGIWMVGGWSSCFTTGIQDLVGRAG